MGMNSRAMVADRRISYSFAFIPTKIEEILKENTNLEIGEDVSWTTEQLIGRQAGESILKSLVNVVNEVVKKIDGVGYGNNMSVSTTEG
jgi:hypothetical protein